MHVLQTRIPFEAQKPTRVSTWTEGRPGAPPCAPGPRWNSGYARCRCHPGRSTNPHWTSWTEPEREPRTTRRTGSVLRVVARSRRGPRRHLARCCRCCPTYRWWDPSACPAGGLRSGACTPAGGWGAPPPLLCQCPDSWTQTYGPRAYTARSQLQTSRWLLCSAPLFLQEENVWGDAMKSEQSAWILMTSWRTVILHLRIPDVTFRPGGWRGAYLGFEFSVCPPPFSLSSPAPLRSPSWNESVETDRAAPSERSGPRTCAGRWCAVRASNSRLCLPAKSAAPANSHWFALAASSPPEVSGSAKFTAQLSETKKTKKDVGGVIVLPSYLHCLRGDKRSTFLSVFGSPKSNSSPSVSSSLWLDRAEGAMLVEASRL